MTRGIDNDEWFKHIGAVTVDEDDQDDDLTADDDPQPAAHGEDFDSRRGEPLGSDDDYDVAEEEPPLGSDDDYDDQGRGLLLGSPFDGDDPVVDLDNAAVVTPAPMTQPPRRFTPWVLAAFGAAAVVGNGDHPGRHDGQLAEHRVGGARARRR